MITCLGPLTKRRLEGIAFVVNQPAKRNQREVTLQGKSERSESHDTPLVPAAPRFGLDDGEELASREPRAGLSGDIACI